MTARTGQISVDTKNIFPIIKKWLYSEHDIFLRELVSNSCDAITKRAALSRGKNVEIPEGKVKVEINKTQNVIRIHDNGVGMTEDEVEKYIANLAFSGAEEFAKKMQDMSSDITREDIIGKFGLGFYSAFMVADKVEVDTKSMEENATAVKWVCEGETDYEFQQSDRESVGTTISLFINEDSKEFLESHKTRQVVYRYCDFMPYPIVLEDVDAQKAEAEAEARNKKDAEEKGNEYIEPVRTEDIINDTDPIWKKEPSSLKDEDYKNFYKKLFPMDGEPLFWIHLNVDHPFELQGILYFPKLNPNKPLQENGIKLYCKQVFVSDNVKSIVPDFLGLLKGVIDSTDIPLNVSRSSLQGDPNVKKIANYVIKKVAEALKKLHRNDRKRFEEIWTDISLFVKYGATSDDKFDEILRDFIVYPTNKNTFVTFQEYQDSIPAEYKEKMKGKILSYPRGQGDISLINTLDEKGLMSVETDDVIDPHFTQHVEIKGKEEQKIKFSPIDEEIENLLKTETSEEEVKEVKDVFNQAFGIKEEDENKPLSVEVVSFTETGSPAYFKLDHQMKRFEAMTRNFGGESPFAMPARKTLVVNPKNQLVQNALKLFKTDANKELGKKLCFHVQDLAQISGEGLDNKDKDIFVKRSQELLSELTNLAL